MLRRRDHMRRRRVGRDPPGHREPDKKPESEADHDDYQTGRQRSIVSLAKGTLPMTASHAGM